jgi:hypothetical protein
VPEAAAALGITEGAVRGRVKRGTLRSYRESGTVYVILEGVSSSAKLDEPRDSPGDQSELVAVLREQLAAERQAHAEARRIIAGLVERIPQLEAPRESPEAPRGSPEAAETVEESPEEESPEEAEPHLAAEEARAELVAERALRQMAEATLHDGMSEERRRREEAERERDGMRQELHALRRQQQEAHDAAEEQQGKGQPQSATGGAQQGARRPWWRRVFGR